MVSGRAATLAALLVWTTPVAAQVAIRDLVEVTDISGVGLSPDGGRLVFRTAHASIGGNAYASEWHLASTRGDDPQRIIGDGGAPLWTDAGVMIDGSAVWDPASRFVYYRALVDGVIGLWRAAVTGSGAQLLTHEDGDIHRFTLSPDGQKATFAIGAPRSAIEHAEAREYDTGILVDRSVDPAQALFRGALVNGRPATQRLTGRWFARAGLLADIPERVRSLDFATGSIRDVAATETRATRDADEPIASARSAGGDVARLVATPDQAAIEVTRGNGSPPLRCRSSLCRDRRIVATTWWPKHDAVLLTGEDAAHAQRLMVWHMTSDRVRIVADDPGLLAGGRDSRVPCAVDSEAAYCVAAGPNSPPQLVRIDLSTGHRAVLFDPNASLRRRLAAIVVERVDWTDHSGQAFTGQLFRRAKASPQPLPLVVNYYRCDGFIRGGLGDEWPFAPLAEAGIISLCINKPAEPVASQDAEQRYDQALSGVRSAIDLLAHRGLIDRDRVGMGGLSFGSEAAMWIAMRSDLLRAVSIASVQLEPAYYWFNGVAGSENHANLAAVWGLGAPDATSARWQQISPALNVDHIAAPVLLQLPEQEARLSMELYARLTSSTTPAELYAFPDEPHIKVQPRHKVAAYQRNLDWFRFWLQGYIDSDPLKVDQVSRWQALARRQSSSQARAQSSIDTRSKIRK